MRTTWIFRLPCGCVFGAAAGEHYLPDRAAAFLFGDILPQPGMSLELVVAADFDREIRPTLGEHTCGGAS